MSFISFLTTNHQNCKDLHSCWADGGSVSPQCNYLLWVKTSEAAKKVSALPEVIPKDMGDPGSFPAHQGCHVWSWASHIKLFPIMYSGKAPICLPRGLETLLRCLQTSVAACWARTSLPLLIHVFALKECWWWLLHYLQIFISFSPKLAIK